MKVKVTQMSYFHNQFGEPIVDIWGRTETGKRAAYTLSGFVPYFYLDEHPRPHEGIMYREEQGLSLYNEELIKVTVKSPGDVPEIRKHYPVHYEADVPFVDRVRYDLGIKSVIEIDAPTSTSIVQSQISPAEADITPRYWNFDIETSDEHGFADPKYPTGQVLSFSIFDSYTQTIYYRYRKTTN